LPCLVGQHRARGTVSLGQPEIFDVDKEERFVTPIEKFGKADRPANVAAELIEDNEISRQAVNIVEEVVCIERRIPMLPEEPAMKFVRPLLGDESDLHRAATCALCTRRRG